MDNDRKVVFFTCSTNNFPKHRKKYLRIINFLQKLDLQVNSNISLEEFSSAFVKPDYSQYSNSSTYFPTTKKIAQSDLVIVDATVYSMTMGNIVSYALSMKKHCLLITENRRDDPQDLFIAGNESVFLHYKIYNSSNVEKLIRDFIKEAGRINRVRVNFVLDKEVNDRLEWLGFRTKLSKTEIIKQAINNYEPDIDD